MDEGHIGGACQRRRGAVSGPAGLLTAAALGALTILSCGEARAQQGPFVYVPNGGDNNLSVIDTSANAVLPATISAGSLPSSVAVRGDEAYAYVTNNSDNTVSVIDTASNSVTATIAVGLNPIGVAVSPDGKTAYVTNVTSNSVSVINTASNSVTATIAVGATPLGITVSPDGKTAYVTNETSNSVSVINTASNSVTAIIAVGSFPIGIAVSPDGKTAYVVNDGGDTVSVVNTASNSVTATIPVGSFPESVVVSPDGKTAYVTNLIGNSVSVINTTTDTVTATLSVGFAPLVPGVCGNGNALLASGLTFKANSSGALACTLSSGPSGSPGPVFTGGTLQFAGAGITSALPITLLAGGGTFDTDGNNATLSGSISGPGGLTKIGAGTLTLSGSGTYSGPTLVSAGTLQGGAVNAFSPNSAYTVASGAVLDIGGFGQVIGSLSGAGIVTNSGAGLAILTVGADNTSTVFSGTIQDDGQIGLTKTGSGTLTLTGTNTYSGPTTISGGTLDVEGSIANSVATVQSGGTLAGAGTVGGLTIASGGILAPGAITPFTTLSVAGNVTFQPGSIFQVNVNPAGQSDKLAVTGTATLQGGTVQVLAGSGTYLPTTRYTLLTANGGVSGTFASLSAASNLAFLSPALSYDANDVYLGFTPAVTATGAPVTFPSVAITRNEAATAAAVQALGLGNPVYNAVLNQSVPGARQAFDALSGEVHASAVTAAFEDSRLPRDAILDRMSQPLDTPYLGVASTMTGAYAADLPSRKGPVLAPVAVQMYQPRLYGLWAQGFGDWGSNGSDHNAAKLSRNTGGFIVGADADVGHLFGLGNTWRFGVAGGYTDDSLSVSQRSSSGDFQTVFGAIYGGTHFGAVDLKVGVIGASTNTRTNRTVSFPLFNDVASASYGGDEEQAFAELGYRLPYHATLWSFVPGLESLRVNYEPFLQAAQIHLDQNRYAETSFAGSGLIGRARSYDMGTTTLGLRSEYSLSSLPGFTLRTMIGWQHAFGDVKPSVAESFPTSFASFSVNGVPVARDALVSETTLDYAITDRITLGLSYSSQLGRKSSDSAVKGSARISF